MVPTITAFREAIATLRRAPAAVGYAFVGGLLAAGVAMVGIAGVSAVGYLAVGVLVGPLVVPVWLVALGTALFVAYLGAVLLCCLGIWVCSRAAAIHVIGRRLREEQPATAEAVVDAWRPLFRWAALRWLSLGYVGRYLPGVARWSRWDLVDTTSHGTWRRRVTFLPHALVLEDEGDVESAVARSRTRVDAAGCVPRLFVVTLPVFAALAVATFVGFLTAGSQYDSAVLVSIGVYSLVGVPVLGVITASTFDLAVRTRRYVELDDVVDVDSRDDGGVVTARVAHRRGDRSVESDR
ncbi:hypothetical protein [Natronobeatus ordinarius]|uniref:hypothetical protein n=1 Tax=Natronobeatus ordinarius TaxID=2963433 RepID=UPI0020CE0DE0|nr:hypothetical protein [Natronobeatus ordinarius]